MVDLQFIQMFKAKKSLKLAGVERRSFHMQRRHESPPALG
jgi:hypothetical protein